MVVSSNCVSVPRCVTLTPPQAVGAQARMHRPRASGSTNRGYQQALPQTFDAERLNQESDRVGPRALVATAADQNAGLETGVVLAAKRKEPYQSGRRRMRPD